MAQLIEKSVFEHLDLKLDPYLFNLLEYHGFNTVETLKLITIDVIEHIQTYAQQELPKLIKVEEFAKYYGLKATTVAECEKFTIPLAHRMLLLNVLPLKIEQHEK